MMRQIFRFRPLAILCLVTGCVTVNVYFPAAAAEQAADQIIRHVYGSDQPPAPVPAPAPEDEPVSLWAVPDAGPGMRLLDLLVPAARAQQPDLDISTPGINKLQAVMAARHGQLVAYYRSGAVGMDNNGLITLRDTRAVGIKDRNKVNQLIAAENSDRNALYMQIAKANGHPEWETDIRGTFARRWVANAPGGWFFQDATGGWKQK